MYNIDNESERINVTKGESDTTVIVDDIEYTLIKRTDVYDDTKGFGFMLQNVNGSYLGSAGETTIYRFMYSSGDYLPLLKDDVADNETPADAADNENPADATENYTDHENILQVLIIL